MTMPGTERRRHPRVVADLPLQLVLSDRTVDTRILNLSSSGIRIDAPSPIPLMSRVQIALSLPDSGATAGPPLSINGVVVRCEKQDAGSYDTAIFFDSLADDARRRLDHFVTDLL